MIILICLGLLSFFSATYVVAELILRVPSLRLAQHFCVALTFLIFSIVLAELVPLVYNWGIEGVQSFLRSNTSKSRHGRERPPRRDGGAMQGSTAEDSVEAAPSLREVLANHLTPIDNQASLLDVQAIACLLLCEYGFMIIASHLVDIIRYLKISRRRIRLQKMKERH